MDWLRSYRPDLVPRYEELYAGGAYAPKEERQRLMRLVRNGTVPTLPSPVDDHRGVRRTGPQRERARPTSPAPEQPPRQRPPAPVQQALF
jgi:hypothetical protein